MMAAGPVAPPVQCCVQGMMLRRHVTMPLLVCSLCPGIRQFMSLPNSCSFPAATLACAVVLESILLRTAPTPSLGPAELLT